MRLHYAVVLGSARRDRVGLRAARLLDPRPQRGLHRILDEFDWLAGALKHERDTSDVPG